MNALQNHQTISHTSELHTSELQREPTVTVNSSWEEGGEEYYDDEDAEGEEVDEIDAAAEAVARRLGDQLLAQIGVAFGTSTQTQVQPHASTSTEVPPAPAPDQHQPSEEESIISTIRFILSQANSNPELQSALEETTVPYEHGDEPSLFTVLSQISSSGYVDPDQADLLSGILSTIASSLSGEDDEGTENNDAVTSSSPRPQNQGKRKREDTPSSDTRPRQRHFPHSGHLYNQVAHAVAIITSALSQPSHAFGPIDPGLVASIQVPLYQVFLFCATSGGAQSSGGSPSPDTPSPKTGVLHEICGLIQVVGVLAGIPIGPPPAVYSTTFQSSLVDIGTAVYPCRHPDCGKIFSRLYSLRSHARLHVTERPFRCDMCTAAFARNHDLRRHTRSHGTRAYKCVGCQKTFSRRDALKRHKSNARDIPECSSTPVEVVDTLLPSKLRRPRPRSSNPHEPYAPENEVEDGEVNPEEVEHAREVTASVHAVLHNRIAQAVGVEKDAEGQGAWPSAFTAFVNGAHLPSSSSAADGDGDVDGAAEQQTTPLAPLTEFGLNEEQTRLLENAIARAAAAAQAQAEAEARIEEEGEGSEEEDYEEEDAEGVADEA